MFSHVNGDGTVPVLSALSDPFPKQYVADRIVLPGAEHFGILQDKRLYELLDEILEE